MQFSQLPSSGDLFENGGNMGEWMRSQDWSQTSLGAITSWSATLRNMVSLCLNSPFPCALWWGCERIRLCNDAYQAVLGATPPQGLGPGNGAERSVENGAGNGAGNEASMAAMLEQVWQTGQAVRVEHQRLLVNRNGSVQECDFTISHTPIWEETGTIGGICTTAMEVTAAAIAPSPSLPPQPQQTRAMLDDVEERLQLVLTSVHLVIWDVDLKTSQVVCSDNAVDVMGIQSGSSEAFWALIHPADRNRVFQAYQQSLVEGTIYSIEYRILNPQGGMRWLYSQGQVFRNAEGQPERLFGVSVDVSDRKLAEEALSQSEERLRVALKNSPITIFNQDRDLRYTWVYSNPTQEGQFEQFLGKQDQELLSPEEAEVFTWLKQQVMETGVGAREEIKLSLGAQENYFDITIEPLRTAAGEITGVTCAAINITERKRSEVAKDFLSTTSALLSSSIDYETTVTNILRLVVPALADYCFFDVVTADQQVQRVAWHHIDPDKQEWFNQIQQFVPPQEVTNHPINHVLSSGQAYFVPQVGEEWCEATAFSLEHLQFLQGCQPQSLIVVPLIARDRKLGALTLALTSNSGRTYTASDLTLAIELAYRAALVLDNAQLYRQSQTAQQAAERFADRTARLQGVTAALSEALTPQQVAEVVVIQGVEALGAQAGVVGLISADRTALEFLGAFGYPQEIVESWNLFPIDGPFPLADAVQTGMPLFLETAETITSRYPSMANVLPITGNQAMVALPLIVEGHILGGMGISFVAEQDFSAEDKRFVLALAQQCAQAIARAQLYEAEQQARQDAESANRVKDEFLAVLSHELRSPLNPILGWASLLRSRKVDEKTFHQAMETIERNARLQTQLIEDLLDVSRILQGKLNLTVAPVDLVTIVNAAIETVRLAADAKLIRIQTQFEPESGLVAGDAGRLQQVVWNLLSNAVKFTPQNGQVQITLSLIENQIESQPSGATDHPIRYALLRVSDTGIGIDPIFLPYVFDYFRQADGTTTRKFGGLGLGLAIVRHLVELHGGTVRADSLGEGQGATFTVQLPLWQAAQNPMEPFPPSPEPLTLPPSALADLHILLVDDKIDTCNLLTTLLMLHGARVTAVSSAQAALQVLTQPKPKSPIPNFLISDIGMPGMDGCMLMHRIRTLPPEQGRQIPAIALTAYAGEADRQRILTAGFQRHVTKPIDLATLIATIVELLEQR